MYKTPSSRKQFKTTNCFSIQVLGEMMIRSQWAKMTPGYQVNETQEMQKNKIKCHNNK